MSASAAVDGNSATRWSSVWSDPQWIQIDLGASASINQVVLRWETAYASAFKIQVSNDAVVWQTIYSTTTGAGGVQTLNVGGTGRYVRMYGTARGTGWGYSLWEFEVWGLYTGCGTTDAALNQTATASSVEGGLGAYAAIDGNSATRWSSVWSDPQWIQVDLGASLHLCQVWLNWETAYASAFQIQVSNDAATWTTVYSTTTGTGGVQALNVGGTGRYVRMSGTARGTGWGYSLWDLQVYVAATDQPDPVNCTIGLLHCQNVDVNGDGVADQVGFLPSTAGDALAGRMVLAPGNATTGGYGQPLVWPTTTGCGNPAKDCMLIDDGFGRADLLEFIKSSVTAPATDPPTGAPEGSVLLYNNTSLHTPGFGSPQIIARNICYGGQICRLADMTGDGLPDLVSIVKNGDPAFGGNVTVLPAQGVGKVVWAGDTQAVRR